VRSTARASAVRVVTPILWKMLRRWVSTVFLAQEQFRGDLRVGLAVDDEPRHLEFASGQRLYACSVGLARADPVGAAARRLSGGCIYVFARECRDHPPGALDDPLVRLAPDDRPHDRGCRFLVPRCGGA